MSSGSQAAPKSGGRKNVHEPVEECPRKLGAMTVQVVAVRAVEHKGEKKGVADIKVVVTGGPTEVGPKKTDGKGLVTFTGLKPGAYTVEVKVEGRYAKLYDVSPPPASQSKAVRASKTTAYYFELPYHWITFFVTYPDDKAVTTVEYKFNVKKLASNGELDKDWAVHSQGLTPKAVFSEEFIPKGRYQLVLKMLWDAAWPKAEVIVGEAVELKAAISGFAAGEAGSFVIFDSRNLVAKPLHTVEAKVEKEQDAFVLKGSWTPTKEQLKDLVSGHIVFQAKASKALAFSGPARVVTKDKYEVVDQKGTKLDTPLKLYFSGGDTAEADAVAGEAEILTPWGQDLSRIELAGYKTAKVKLEADGAAARSFLLPA